MSGHHSISPLTCGLLALLLVKADAQWMNDGDTSHQSSNDRLNPWQSRDAGPNSRHRTSRLRISTRSDNTTNIVDTTFRGQDDTRFVTQESFVDQETEDTQFHVNSATSLNRTSLREKKPIARTSKVESNTPAFGQGRSRLDDSLPPVPVGPFHNPLGPTSVPFEATTRSWSRPHSGQAPGSFAPGVPPLAPAPPFGPPATPPPSVTGGQAGAGVSAPSPPMGQAGTGVKPPSVPIVDTEITSIQCRNRGDESFQAVLALPTGFEAVPVFEDAPTVDATTNPYCRMIPTQRDGMFQLFVSHFKQCGVAQCRQGGSEMLLCLVLRFPLMTGIKLPEDTIIEIRCRPQEKTAEDNAIVRVATAKNSGGGNVPGEEAKSPSIFEGGGAQFESKLEIYTKYRGTDQFHNKVGENEEVDLGEEIQLRSEVKSDDGWEYSRMVEVVIQRVGGSQTRSSFNTAVLVFTDGCRNPEFQVIAKSHPLRDVRNPLIVNFNFRIFMFQDMVPGDSLMVSAKVIGCVEQEDCAPVNCLDDNNNGFGKRRRRSTSEMTITKEIEASEFLSLTPPPRTRPKRSMEDLNSIQHGSTIDWDRRFGIKVRFPEGTSSPLVQESLEALECRSYLFITMGVATFFCFVTFIFAMILFYRSRPKVIPSEMTLQVANRDVKVSALSASVPKEVLSNEHYVQETSHPAPNTISTNCLERNVSHPLYVNNSAAVIPARRQTRELENNMNNIHDINNLSQNEDEENYFYPKEDSNSVTRRPSAVIKINNDEPDKSIRNASVKRQPSTVIRINDNETHTTIFNQKPTPKPRLIKETNG